MKDLTWVQQTKVVREDDPAKEAIENNPGWHLLHVTGGLYGPVEYVYGWGDIPADEIERLRAENDLLVLYRCDNEDCSSCVYLHETEPDELERLLRSKRTEKGVIHGKD